MRETELKIVLDEAQERRLKEGLARSGLNAGAPATDTLRSIYFDTHDHRLREAGIALRLREKAGGWVQTVKSGKSIASGLSKAMESECPVPGGELDIARIPDEKIREQILESVKGARLAPVCESRIERKTYQISLPGGGEIELAIDAGRILAGERAEELREAELELKTGEPSALYAAARKLFPEGGMQFSTLSKAERGFLLAAEGRIMPPIAPRNAQDVPLSRDQGAEDAARAVLRECLDQIAANMLAVRHADAAEGPHQLRIGLRRLRAAFTIFRDCIPLQEGTRLKDQARLLGRAVSRKRDLDVALSDVVRPEAAAHPGLRGFPALIDGLVQAGEAERRALSATLTSARAQGFLLDLAAFVETADWPGNGITCLGTVADTALDKAWRRVKKRARGIESLSVEKRHELRKSVKRLRYTAEFLGPLYRQKKVKPFVRYLKALQELFGELNDAAMIQAMFEAPDAPAGGNPAAQRAAGLVIGIRTERAEHDWAEARYRWRALKSAPRFWR
ncbi:MAG: CHAD domain-containing protein [Paracoccaceae bacterium]|nr:CHAD domain-containing protein [Paracoccaceae bacterium]